ncbi:MAG: hypothetical protein WAP34_03600 [Desulfomonilia bacterium]|nr:hypothetical protein [Deltaproteobacteria bacterium]MDI9542414.1 hypothetical protein [Pseudomonadota bacterium]
MQTVGFGSEGRRRHGFHFTHCCSAHTLRSSGRPVRLRAGRYTFREIELHTRRFLSKFNSDFRSLLREKGVGLDTPIELGHASDGSVMVTNDHPHRNAIEAIFAERPELRNEYTKITSMLTLVEHARKAGAFHQAYREDPRAAAARYASLFTSSASVGIRISEHGTDIVLHRRTRRSG